MSRRDYPERTIITTWQISFDEIQVKNEEAAWLLRLWGYLDSQELSFELLQWRGYESAAPGWLQNNTANEITFLATIDTLLDYSLIERNDNSYTFSIHRVVHDWIQASVIGRGDIDLFWTAIATIGLAVPHPDTRDSATIQRRLLQHADQCLLYWDTANFQQHLDEAYLTSLDNLGSLYLGLGKLDKAEKVYQQALRGNEAALGPDHPNTLEAVKSLAVIYRRLGKFDKSENMSQQALRGFEAVVGPDNPSTLQTVNNLGVLYNELGKLDEAEKMHQRALGGYEAVLGPDHTGTLRAVNGLGNVYSKLGKLGEAEKMYQRALQGYEAALGPDHPNTLGAVNNLGLLYRQLGKLEEARNMYQRTL
jgi:tetratricopeptide (TPR) repeat protein